MSNEKKKNIFDIKLLLRKFYDFFFKRNLLRLKRRSLIIKFINRMYHLNSIKFNKDQLNTITRKIYLQETEGVDFSGYQKKQVCKIYKFGKEDIFISRYDTYFNVVFEKCENSEYLEFQYGFIRIPLEVMSKIFKLEIYINDKIVSSINCHPSRDEFFMERKQEKIHSFRWRKVKVSLRDIKAKKINLKLRITSDEDLQNKNVTIGWTNINLINKIKVNRIKNEGKRKNYILVLCDALRYDKVFTELTPYLNSISDDCIMLDPTYSVASWTWPSTASILTGMLPMKHQVYKFDKNKISSKVKTLPEYFQENGYLTIGFTSNPLITERFGFDRGFDHFYHPGNYLSLDFFLPYLKKWLKLYKENHFLMFIHTMETHEPYDAPFKFKLKAKASMIRYSLEKYHQFTKDVNHNNNPSLIEKKYLEKIVKQYNAEVLHFDNNLKRLVKMLKVKNLYEDTVLIIFSDHGEEFLEHGGLTHDQNIYNTLLKVPLIVIGKDIKDIQKDMKYSLMDILPTLLDYEGFYSDENFDGTSLNKKTSDFELFISSYNCFVKNRGRNPKFGLIFNDYKIIYFPILNEWEFYNLEKDPNEKKNIYEEVKDTEIFKKVKAIFAGYLKKSDIPSEKQTEQIDKKLEDTLRGMGYI